MTSDETKGLKASPQTVYDLLSNGTFQVPWHQREYVWKTDEVELFWEDLRSSCENEDAYYFIGPIVLTPSSNGAFHVQDGQQRLVTYSLLCEALRRASEQNKDPQAAAHNSEVRKLLFDTPVAMPRQADINVAGPRIQPPSKNKVNYDLIIKGKPLEPNGHLIRAWNYLRNQAESLLPTQRDAFLRFVLGNIMTVQITTRADKATQIFEAINARGTSLRQVELVMNHFYYYFGESDHDKTTIHENLDRMVNHFRGANGVSRMEKYVRCYMQCRYGPLSEKDLYRQTKAKFQAAIKDKPPQEKGDYIRALVIDMTKQTSITAYEALEKPDVDGDLISRFLEQSQRDGETRTIQDFVFEMKPYGVTRPLMFAIFQQYQNASSANQRRHIARNGARIARALATLVMRIAITSDKFAPQRVETPITEHAHIIYQNLDQQTTANCIAALNGADPAVGWSDQEFTSRIELLPDSSDANAKKTLISVYRHYQPDLSITMLNRWTIEHILPQSDTHINGWPAFDKESHSSYRNHVGNLTLLPKFKNKGTSSFNASFNAKRPALAESLIQENKNISELPDWTPQEIKDRFARTVDSLCQIWQKENS